MEYIASVNVMALLRCVVCVEVKSGVLQSSLKLSLTAADVEATEELYYIIYASFEMQ